jgi:hypothetical protein
VPKPSKNCSIVQKFDRKFQAFRHKNQFGMPLQLSPKKEAKECLAGLLAAGYNSYLVDSETGSEIQVTDAEIEAAKTAPRKSIFG